MNLFRWLRHPKATTPDLSAAREALDRAKADDARVDAVVARAERAADRNGFGAALRHAMGGDR